MVPNSVMRRSRGHKGINLENSNRTKFTEYRFLHILSPLLLVVGLLSAPYQSPAQGFDSTQIGKEYPYHLPFLGDKAYSSGYKLPKPIGVMASYIHNDQGIIIDNFEMAFVKPSDPPFREEDYVDWSDVIAFGPSKTKVNTMNFRADAWVLPFLSVGGYYGLFRTQTNITLEKPFPIVSNTENEGKYYGWNVVAVIPLKVINLQADYTMSFSTNNLLSKPVKVEVSGMRLIKNWQVGKNPDMFLGGWIGAQFQFLEAKTEGKIALNEAIDSSGEFQARLDSWYNGLSQDEKDRYGDRVYEGFNDLVNTTVHYRFDKRLEYNWNLLTGIQWQINRSWQYRAEFGFLRNKQQLFTGLNYRFGIKHK